MSRFARFLVVGWFAALLVVPMVATLFVDRETVDNRAVAPFPGVDLDGLLYGDVPEGIDAYLEDRLAIRDAAAEADARVAYEVFGDSTNDNVLLGDDDWLFSAAVFDLACDPGWPSDEAVVKRLDRLESLLRARQATLTSVIVPEKGWMYRDRLPAHVPELSCADATLRALRSELAATDHYLDLWQAVEAEVDAAPTELYWSTDTHWNDAGRVAILPYLVDALAEGVWDPDAIEPVGVTETQGGDLAAQLGIGLPDQADAYDVVRPGATTTTESLLGDEVFRHRTSGTEPVVEGRTLIITDSHLFVASRLLAPWFEDVVIVRWKDRNQVDLDALVDDADHVVVSFSGRFSGPRMERAGRELSGLVRN